MIKYVQENYPYSLSTLAFVNEQYYIFALKQCYKYALEQLIIDNLKNILLEGGWDQNCVTDDMLKELLAVLQKNNISSKEQICAFLAECMFESDYGRGITEYGSDTYFAGKPYGKNIEEADIFI